MSYKIIVTQDDINNGVRKDCFQCAIARAITRVAGIPHVRVDKAESILFPRGEWQADDITKVNRFIADFDSGHEVRPIEFQLIEHPRSSTRHRVAL